MTKENGKARSNAIKQNKVRFKAKKKEAFAAWERLTPRERNIARLMAIGTSNEDIAANQKISPKTADVQRAAIYDKFQVKSASALLLAVLVAHGVLESFELTEPQEPAKTSPQKENSEQEPAKEPVPM